VIFRDARDRARDCDRVEGDFIVEDEDEDGDDDDDDDDADGSDDGSDDDGDNDDDGLATVEDTDLDAFFGNFDHGCTRMVGLSSRIFLSTSTPSSC